ncbi:enolase C-terminal domain-like protein [Nitratireductor sp. ZSWI3]|uniref:enolase C-terminal domain-like protein n=1 Tax=Nitratireductor sp. ZSWI3 TaxID=2966359 RepID=UPI00215019BD|nr:enolase C-terminal domain-like protein [Nitratireductor sp. ZSWI3]MCR4268322.1 mandelate racemase [Nitratireductor sp. ZSWI3]
MTDAPRLSIREVRLSERPVAMRLPFQFGSTEVRRAAEIYCAVTVEVGSRPVEGVSAQLMVPRWFDKRAGLSNEETVDELRRIAEEAAAAAPGLSGTVAALSAELRAGVPPRLPDGTPALAAGFGPALLEMALIDAVCRSVDLPFWRAAKADLFGLAAHLPPDVSADDFVAALQRIGAPERIALRHTVGFDAPLLGRPEDAPDDGLPVTVAEVAEGTGITAWKIKLKGDPDADAGRLLALQQVLAGRMGGGVTLDANEQYAPDDFRVLLERLRAADLAEIATRIRFFEQPFAREVALRTENDFGVPLIIDESDDDIGSFATALALGWSGTSIKSCKGVLRALVNMARAGRSGAILSGEDLTCQPGLCWTQDTAMAAACGVVDVERNGHHFAGGLQGAAPAERAALQRLHPDIFRSENGRTVLNIDRGHVGIASLSRAGFGASAAVA